MYAAPWVIPQRITSPSPTTSPNNMEIETANESSRHQPPRQQRHALNMTAPTHIQGHMNVFGNFYAQDNDCAPVIQINSQLPSRLFPSFRSLPTRSRILSSNQHVPGQSLSAMANWGRSTATHALEEGNPGSDLPSESNVTPNHIRRDANGSQSVSSTGTFRRRGVHNYRRRWAYPGSRLSNLTNSREATTEHPQRECPAVPPNRPAHIRRVATRRRIRRK